MKIKWKEDLRPMQDKVPAAYEDACMDPRLLIEHAGRVVATRHTFTGGWIFLVACVDRKFREVAAERATLIHEEE